MEAKSLAFRVMSEMKALSTKSMWVCSVEMQVVLPRKRNHPMLHLTPATSLMDLDL